MSGPSSVQAQREAILRSRISLALMVLGVALVTAGSWLLAGPGAGLLAMGVEVTVASVLYGLFG